MSSDNIIPDITSPRAVEKLRQTVTSFGGDVLEFVQLDPEQIEVSLFAIIDHASAARLKVVPIQTDPLEVVFAVADPSNLNILDDLRVRLLPREVRFVAADPARIDLVLRRWARHLARSVEHDSVTEFLTTAQTAETLEAATDDGTMAKIVNGILQQAIAAGASDVHIEPNDEDVLVRFRVDGILQEHQHYKLGLASGLVTRIKVMAKMDITGHRLPLDGRFHRRLNDREIDCRVVSLPTASASGAEGAVIRLLDQSTSRLDLDAVGFHSNVATEFSKLLSRPHGMILVTGPTGSGKTTTLYASLSQVARPDRKVLSIEDPVEIRFPSITQVQVNELAGLTFASALKYFLRADPDVLLIGEIRDAITAELASQAALTGHLVLSTLHTNEASGAPIRLSHMGLDGFVIASALRGVLSQRLLRRLCKRCALPRDITAEEAQSIGFEANNAVNPVTNLPPTRLWDANPDGCSECRNGYSGRVVVAELIVVDEEMRQAIISRASSSEIERIAGNSPGFRPLHADALSWLAEGVTSFAELLRVGV